MKISASFSKFSLPTSRDIPRMTSFGSMTFPSDLLIFRPWASLRMLWNNTYKQGIDGYFHVCLGLRAACNVINKCRCVKWNHKSLAVPLSDDNSHPSQFVDYDLLLWLGKKGKGNNYVLGPLKALYM